MYLPASTFTFDTEDLPPNFREEAWRALLSAQNIQLPIGEPYARLISTSLDRLSVRQMWASPLGTHRTAEVIRRDGLDHLTLHINRAPVHAEGKGEEIKVAANTVTFTDLAQPLRREAVAEQGSPILTLARDLVEEVLPDPGRFHALRLTGAANTLLWDHMRIMANWAPDIQTSKPSGFARATALIVAAAVRPTLSTLGEVRPALVAARLGRARRYIRDRIDDPDLGPEQLAVALGLSRASVYRMFEGLGGVAQYVRNRRMALAWRRLGQRRVTPERVAQVAYACGFTNVAHFTRLFSKTFGISPSEARALERPFTDPALLLRREVMSAWANDLA